LLYKAPEQWAEWGRDSEFSDQRMDIYALAATFFEMLTSFPAFSGRSYGTSYGEIQQAHFNQVERPTLFKYNYELGKIFDDVLKKALAFHPKNRYADVTIFITELKEAYFNATGKKLVSLSNEPSQTKGGNIEKPISTEQTNFASQTQPAKPDLRNPHFKLHMPKSGNFFLDQTESDALVEYICDLVPFKKTTLREIFLLGSKIPETTLSQFNLDESPLWVATHVIQRLQKVGKWQTTDRQHALAGLLNRVIKHSDSWDVKVEIIKLIFRYQLIEDVNEVIKLSEQYAVPPPIPRFSDNNIKLPTNDLDDLESLYNPSSPNYVTIDFFEQGRQAAQAVCRLEWNGKAKGTGFLVADDLVLTNYHVISDTKVDQEILRQRLKNCRIRFEVKGSAYSIELGVDLNRPLENFSPLDALDYVLIRLERPIQEDDNRKPLTCSKFSLDKRPFANIIHYPTGHDMKIVFRNNHIKEVRADRIYYSSDTEKGSSGAPVFNDNWQVIALHRAGEKDRHGNTIRDIDGNVVRDGNEGILLSAIQAENKDLWEINHD